MKRLVTCAAMLLASGAWTASAAISDGEFTGLLSSSTYEHWVDISGNALTCEVQSSNSGYVPIEWAWATLNLAEDWDQLQVIPHRSVSAYATSGNGDPTALCAAVEAVRRSAQDGYVAVTKTTTSEVRLQQTYGRGCVRALVETVTLRFSDDLVLTGEEYRILSGDYTQSDCAAQ